MSLDPTGITDAIGSVASLIGKVADKIWPDPQERAKAQALIMEAEREGKLAEINAQLQAIMAEAKSPDPWTSRARPSFLYVVYVFLLWSIPMGITYAIKPDVAQAVASGVQMWLGALPDKIVDLFQWVMLGYVGARSIEKVKGAAK